MTEHIATAIQNAITYLGQHPDEARYTDSPATARIEADLRCTVEGPDGAAMTTDMPTGVGGGNSAPSPGWFLRAAIASCDATLITMRAAQKGVKLNFVEVTVDSESDDRGILGMNSSIPAGPFTARVRVKLSADEMSAEELEEIVQWAHKHCPVSDAVARAIPTEVELEIL